MASKSRSKAPTQAAVRIAASMRDIRMAALFIELRSVPGSNQQDLWGHAGSTGSVRRYMCYVCGRCVDTDSNNHRPTSRALETISSHIDGHLGKTTADQIRRAKATITEKTLEGRDHG